MSYTSSRPPEADFSRNSHSESQHNSDSRLDPHQKPIMRLMREKNSYLLAQVQSEITPKQQPSSNSPEIKNLKQFQRSLQKQRPPQIDISSNPINNSFHNSTIKSSTIHSPKGELREKFVSSFIINESTSPNEEDDNIAFNHRVMQTTKYGNENLDKIRRLIVDEKPAKSPKSPKKNKKQQILQYNATSSIQKLHKTYIKTEEDRRNQYIKKFYADEMRQVKPFKIDNPMSQFLADKRAQKEGTGHKPLHERSIELAKKISEARLQKHQQAQQQRRLKIQQQDRQFQQIQKQRYPNASTKQRQEQFYNQMMQRQKQKNQLKQQQKIQQLKQVTKVKPFVSKASQELFNKITEQKDIPKNFIQRNMEYQAERAKEKIRQIYKHDEVYCPFKPKISQESKEIAKRYYDRKDSKRQQHSHRNCFNQVPEKDQLHKKLKLIQQKIKQKKTGAQESLNKHKRTNSAIPIGFKPLIAREKSNSNFGKTRHSKEGGLSERKTGGTLREEDVPLYNRSDYGNRRTNSCFNLNKK